MAKQYRQSFSPRIDTLRWGVGLLTALIGAMMLVTPSQFGSPVYAMLRPDLLAWGLAFLAAGIGLIALLVFRPGATVVLAVHLAAGAALLFLAYGLALVGGWTGTASFALLGLGTLVAPSLERRGVQQSDDRQASDEPDMLALAIGFAAALTGLSILAFPSQFGSPIYDVIRAYLPLFGFAFLASGLGLIYVHSWLGRPRRALVAAHLLAGSTLLAFCAISAYPLHAWIGIAYYGGFGVGLVLYPWIRPAAMRVDAVSLQARLAFSLALVASLPLVLVTALIEELTSRAVGPTPEVERARDLAFLVLLVTIALGAYIGVRISRRLARPLTVLSLAANELARGHATAPLPSSRVAEVDSLSRSFGAMRDELATRTAERERLLGLVREQAARAEQRAAELDAILNSMADGLIIYDRRGDAVRVNPAAERILGYSREHFVGDLRARSDRIGPRGADDTPYSSQEHPVARSLRGETTSGQMIFHPREGGAVWALVSAAPIRGEHDSPLGAVMTFADITAQHQLEQAREEFLSLVSHDLRNPLTSIQGSAQLLRRQLSGGEARTEAMLVDAILRASDRMSAMIRDLVESARLESGRLTLRRQPTDVQELVDEVVKNIADGQERDRVRIELARPLPDVPADPERVERVLDNLVSNALKYSAAPAPVVVRAHTSNGEVVVSVADEGPGIPREDLPHVFDKYYRARTGLQVEGLGLGLYITRLIAEAHGGRIWVESEPGRGSVFSFALPTNALPTDALPTE